MSDVFPSDDINLGITPIYMAKNPSQDGLLVARINEMKLGALKKARLQLQRSDERQQCIRLFISFLCHYDFNVAAEKTPLNRLCCLRVRQAMFYNEHVAIVSPERLPDAHSFTTYRIGGHHRQSLGV